MTNSQNNPIIQYMSIVSGNDYLAADGRALTWFSPQFPDLTGAKITMTTGSLQSHLGNPLVFSPIPVVWTATVSGTPSKYVATLPVKASQTTAITEGAYDYVLTAELTDLSLVTLATGQLTVIGTPGQVI